MPTSFGFNMEEHLPIVVVHLTNQFGTISAPRFNQQLLHLSVPRPIIQKHDEISPEPHHPQLIIAILYPLKMSPIDVLS